MENILTGRAHIFGDNINTDYIIAGKYTKTLDFTTLAEHVFEDSSGVLPKSPPGRHRGRWTQLRMRIIP